MSKQKAKGAADRKASTAKKPVGGLAIASNWPVHEVLVSRSWAQPGALVTLLIARRSPTSGKVAVALLLVDLGCLGVKSAQVQLAKDVGEYNQGLRAHALRIQPTMPISLNLAAKIVFTGLAYADNLGFKPDPVYIQAAHLLTNADPDAEPTPVPTGGPEGKPFYLNGPYDNPRKIIDQLVRKVGLGNFYYVLQDGGDGLDLPEEYFVQASNPAPDLPEEYLIQTGDAALDRPEEYLIQGDDPTLDRPDAQPS